MKEVGKGNFLGPGGGVGLAKIAFPEVEILAVKRGKTS